MQKIAYIHTFEVKKFNLVSMSDVSLPAINLLDVRMFINSSRPNHIMRILNYAYTLIRILPVKLGLRDCGLKMISFQIFVNCGILLRRRGIHVRNGFIVIIKQANL